MTGYSKTVLIIGFGKIGTRAGKHLGPRHRTLAESHTLIAAASSAAGMGENGCFDERVREAMATGRAHGLI
jgi:phosphoglycerate dehydrogenase-like enzyme